MMSMTFTSLHILDQLLKVLRGAYQTSCSDCTLVSVSDRDKRTCYLKCQCYNMAGSKVETKVDLSKNPNLHMCSQWSNQLNQAYR